jgi:hypothetical protein
MPGSDWSVGPAPERHGGMKLPCHSGRKREFPGDWGQSTQFNMTSIRRLFARKGFRAHPVNRQTVVYVEDGRKMDVAGEMLADGFCVYVASIVAWNDSKGELIDDSERQRIVRNIKASLESQGARVVLD